MSLQRKLLLLVFLGVTALAPLIEMPGTYTAAWADDDDDDDDDNGDDDDDDDDPRAELIISGLTQESAAALTRRGFTVTEMTESDLLAEGVGRVLAPQGLGPAAALREVNRLAPGATGARNDLFLRSPVGTYRPQGEPCGESCKPFVLTGWTPAYLSCVLPAPIGVVDTGVDISHPALAGADVELKTVRRSDRRPSDREHGTGVVSVLVGQPGSRVVGIAPRTKVVAVDAFHRFGRTDATDAFDLIAALDVLADRGVGVINMSLSGPENALLQRAVARLVERGTTIVAAAGTPSGARGGYPARYDGVIAVAAVDQSMKPSRLSARGPHIALSAPGVGIPVAAFGGTSRLASGTSFATPFVSAVVAVIKAKDGGDSIATVEKMQGLAMDLGAPGRDPVFGWGLVQFPEAGGC